MHAAGRLFLFTAALTLFSCAARSVCGQEMPDSLEARLLQTPADALAEESLRLGNAQRGAILFHQPHIGCSTCHISADGSAVSGPDLSRPEPDLPKGTENDGVYVVESILRPSAVIRRGFEPFTVITQDGRTRSGFIRDRTESELRIVTPGSPPAAETIPNTEIEEVTQSRTSLMPQGVVRQLTTRTEFLDLVRYVIEIRRGGPTAAAALQPPPGTITAALPAYEEHVDHAGLIRSADRDAFERGKAIYERLCVNCHGDHSKPGSLPTALRFAKGRFRSGNDPYTMYRTLTRGFGLMVAQRWMVPRQKYDVIHYIREAYVRRSSAGITEITEDYLQQLPPGDTFGPDPVETAPWSDMNYGPSLVNTYEFGTDGSNFAYKGIAVRLDRGTGGISRGRAWAVFDHDTLRLAAFWTRPPESDAAGFIDWRGIHFDGRHGVHPRAAGDIRIANPTGPGWARPGTTDFSDTDRVVGRDDRRYGPLPRSWARYRGLHLAGDHTVVEYEVGNRKIFEAFSLAQIAPPAGSAPQEAPESPPVLVRSLSSGPSDSDDTLLVATHPSTNVSLRRINDSCVALIPDSVTSAPSDLSRFSGDGYFQTKSTGALDMVSEDFTITADIRTQKDGVIFSQANAEGPWTPDGKALFIRGGRLTYDIGWVGAVRSEARVSDGRPHRIAMTWDSQSGRTRFYVDGRPSGGGTLRPKGHDTDHVCRIGFASDNFPADSLYQGVISQLAFYRGDHSDTLQNGSEPLTDDLIARWTPRPVTEQTTQQDKEKSLSAQFIPVSGTSSAQIVLAGYAGELSTARWTAAGNQLQLTLPESTDEVSLTVWSTAVSPELSESDLSTICSRVRADLPDRTPRQIMESDFKPRTPEILTTQPTEMVAESAGTGFEVHDLAAPSQNPWLARVRLTGHDFFDDGDSAAVCSWDGDVWMVTGLSGIDAGSPLRWRRIVSGLFQPLGLKIVNGTIYVTCRDQLAVLRDRNGDGETDFVECFNNDHQVTEHFHEFAMGLQRDDSGRFYYAKSARHALKAVVPHHGTLLRVSADGTETEIVATGFRAANGVCLNPDGTYIVTDQEGHWNPKNRINWVRDGGFYGNMFGYHDVSDDSDDAMEQPLCWITNAFDRSPAELLWVDSEQWGSLNGSLLNLSYGYGKVFVVPHETTDGRLQGGMCELPIPEFPTGLCRGRFHPEDGGLYLAGMFAWGSSRQSAEGGFYRIRRTEAPALLPLALEARPGRIHLTFSDPIAADYAPAADDFSITAWGLLRSERYGSPHIDEHDIEVTGAVVSDDRRTVTIIAPDLHPSWGMQITCSIPDSAGRRMQRVIHNTIHRLE